MFNGSNLIPAARRRVRVRLVRDDDNASFADGVAGEPVSFRIESDYRPFGDLYISIDDGALDPAIAADLRVPEEDGAFDFAIAIDPHAR